jgi:hypothetical protein
MAIRNSKEFRIPETGIKQDYDKWVRAGTGKAVNVMVGRVEVEPTTR